MTPVPSPIDEMPGRMRTLAGFLGDFEPIPTLTPITTRVVTLNPDLWPSLDGEGDDA